MFVEACGDERADLAPAANERNVADTEQFDATSQFSFGFAHAACHQAQLAVVGCQHGDDAIGFTVVRPTQDDAASLELVHAAASAPAGVPTGSCSRTLATSRLKEVRGLYRYSHTPSSSRSSWPLSLNSAGGT